MRAEPAAHFAVIGAMKCGTSSLHDQLARRSGLYMSRPKEPNFFSDEDRWARGPAWYWRCFAGARPGQLRGESSTHYSKWPTFARAAERLHAMLPEVRLVYVLRDPIERIVSQFMHEWSQREVGGRFEDSVLRHERFIAYSCYARQLEQHLRYCPTRRILLVAFERMIAQPDAELARICRFLSDPSPEEPCWATHGRAQNVSSQRLRRSPIREGVLALPPLQWLKERLPGGLRELLKRPWRMGARPEVSERLRAELVARLDPDLARLGRWTGRPLSCATWREAVLEGPLEWLGSEGPGPLGGRTLQG